MPEEVVPFIAESRFHFTYKNPDKTSLCQGDVLMKTEKLEEVLEEVHPYFLRDEYKYFMVLSQSCDLVRRDNRKCKTPYITLAAVRSYDDFLQKTLVSEHYAECMNGLLLVDQKTSNKVFQYVERLYNNTADDYFFLYKDDAQSFPQSMVAFLKVSIAIKSSLHYDICLEAKKLELSDEFKAKLGWLVGNMYSRVGTTDWDSIMSNQMRQKMIEDEVNSNCIIAYKEQLRELKKQLLDNGASFDTHDDVVKFISSIEVKSKYEQLIDVIVDSFESSCKSCTPEEKTMFINTIRSRKMIKQLLQK